MHKVETLQPKILFFSFILNCPLVFGGSLQVVTENWPPFNYQNENGQIVGEVTDKIKAILAYTDLNYELAIFPWARSYELAKSKPNVLIYSIFRTPERESSFHWFCPISISGGLYLFKLKKSPIRISSLEQAKKYRTGVIRKDIGHQHLLLQGFAEADNLYVTTDENTNINKLFLGEVDFILQSEKELIYRLKSLNKNYSDFVKILRLPQEIKDFHCMALSISSSQKIVNKLKLAFEQWKKEI